MRMLLKNQRQHKLIKARRRCLGQDDVHALICQHEHDRLRPSLLKLAGKRSQFESERVLERSVQPSAAKRFHALDIQPDCSVDIASIEVQLSADIWRQRQRLIGSAYCASLSLMDKSVLSD